MSEELSGGIDSAEAARSKPRGSAGAELVIPVAGIAFALYYFTTIWDAPWTAQVSSFFVGTILILCSLGMIARIALRTRRGEVAADFERLIAPRSFIVKRVLLFALTVGYIVVIRWLGFTLTTFLFLLVSILILNDGKRPALVLALAVVLALSGWLLFVVAFEVRFPEGPFEALMGRLL